MTHRMASCRFAVRAGSALAALAVLGLCLGARFRLGIDSQVHKCLPPYSVWLIDLRDRTPRRGAIFAFAAGVAMQPYFAPGQTVVKRMAGLPGDRVAVAPDRTAVEGLPVGEGLALAPTLGVPPDAFARELTVPAGAAWMMGDAPDSFDSRYWGPLPLAQIRGRAYALF